MYGLYLLYCILAGLLAFIVFEKDLILILIFFLYFEIALYLLYRMNGMRWRFFSRCTFILAFFIGYFALFILYGDWDKNNNYSKDNI